MSNTILLFSGVGMGAQRKQGGYNNETKFEHVTVYK